jgi:aminomethyltransferase
MYVIRLNYRGKELRAKHSAEYLIYKCCKINKEGGTMKLFTPLYGKHIEYKAEIIDLFGWQMPAVYTSPEEEYRMVRERAGFTEYSFNSLLAVVGRDAFKFMQKVLVNDLRKISPGRMIYSSILDEKASLVEDGTILWIEDNYFFINAGFNKLGLMEHLKKNASGLEVYIVDTGACFVSFQGPKSRQILQKAMDVKDLPYFGLKRDKLGDIPVLVDRAGFTGELGYEFYVHFSHANALWDTLIELGKEYNVRPYGLAVTEITGIEKGYLFGSDYYQEGTPLEWGLGWTVAFDERDFNGKEALLKRRKEGLKTKLVGFEVFEPDVVAATGDKLLKGSKVIGEVTNGTYGIAIGKSIGRARVNIEYANAREELEVEHKNKRSKIKVAKNYRWYDPENKIVRG